MYNTLKTLCLVPSVSGREEKIREKIKELISPHVDECRTDALGNLIALKRGSSDNAKKIMLCAHMDEIGFLVTHIDGKGFIRVATVGGISLISAAYSSVVSEKGVKGVLVPDAEMKLTDFSADKFVIDIGAKTRKEAARRVSIGDFFVAAPSLTRLCGSRVCGRPIDDRIGCAIMIKLAEALSAPKNDIYFVFSSQEEVGCRGSKPAAYSISPDYAIVFDVTGTGDAVGSKPMECSVGGGAAIKIKDSSVICSAQLVELMTRTAEEEKIPHQHEILTYGGTDTSSIQMSGYGCSAGAISIPTRYIHSGVEMCDLADAEACLELTAALVDKL